MHYIHKNILCHPPILWKMTFVVRGRLVPAVTREVGKSRGRRAALTPCVWLGGCPAGLAPEHSAREQRFVAGKAALDVAAAAAAAAERGVPQLDDSGVCLPDGLRKKVLAIHAKPWRLHRVAGVPGDREVDLHEAHGREQHDLAKQSAPGPYSASAECHHRGSKRGCLARESRGATRQIAGTPGYGV